MVIEEIRKEFRSIITALMIDNPFFALWLRSLPVYVSSDIPIAATDGRAIYINPDAWRRLDKLQKTAVLLHEALHVLLKHPIRRRNLMKRYPMSPMIYNIVEDAKVNQLLPKRMLDALKSLSPVTPATLRAMGIDEPERKSYEEIIAELYKSAKQINVNINVMNDVMPSEHRQDQSQDRSQGQDQQQGQGQGGQGKSNDGDGSSRTQASSTKDNTQHSDAGQQGGGKADSNDKGSCSCRRGVDGSGSGGSPRIDGVVNEGSDEIKNAKDEKELEKAINRRVVEITVAVKSIGKLPGELESVIDEIAKPRIDWRRVLRSALEPVIGRETYKTFAKPNRKYVVNGYDSLPSRRLYGIGRVFVLVDTSGSISDDELRQFTAEIYKIFREAKPEEIVVIPWDARVYEPIKLRNESDVNKLRSWPGRGGTMIREALELTARMMRRGDIVIILSDWAIGDINDERVQRLLKRIGGMAMKAVAITTLSDPLVPSNWMRIRISF